MIMEQKLCATCVALAVLVFAMAVPQGTALARGARGGGMDVRTADLCNVVNDASIIEYDLEAIGTVAAVTDKRLIITAWAVSLEGMQKYTTYMVYNAETRESNCEDAFVGSFKGEFVYTMPPTDDNGEAYQNIAGPTPEVGHIIQICRESYVDGPIIRILEGVLVKGGKEKNKPGRCR